MSFTRCKSQVDRQPVRVHQSMNFAAQSASREFEVQEFVDRPPLPRPRAPFVTFEIGDRPLIRRKAPIQGIWRRSPEISAVR
jgi:hypothetical protein